ncbi:MAG: hypothetical protein ACOH2M_25615 [Cypionkella sp.]
MQGLRVTIALLSMIAMAPMALAAPVNVAKGNPLRAVLLDAMRPTVEDDVGIAVQFVVQTLRVDGDWAYFAGTPQQKNGAPIDFAQTHYAEAINEGYFDGPFLQVLLEASGDEWVVVGYDIGSTDVVAAGWPGDYGVPCAVVGQC